MEPSVAATDGASGSQPAATVDCDLICVRCGYNLRTLAHDALCPECGTRVALTLTLGGELVRSRPAYVLRLAVACRMLFLARLLAFSMLMLEVVAQSRYVVGWYIAGFLLAGMLYAAGACLLAGREHPKLPPELRWSALPLRVLSLVMLLSVPLFALGIWNSVPAGRVPGVPGVPWILRQLCGFLGSGTLIGAGLVALGAFLISPIPETRMMVRLARRLADAWLGEHALIAGIGSTFSGIALVIMFAVMVVGRGMWIGDTAGLILCLIVLVSVLLFWLWLAMCSLIAAKGFGRAARAALARWRSEVPRG